MCARGTVHGPLSLSLPHRPFSVKCMSHSVSFTFCLASRWAEKGEGSRWPRLGCGSNGVPSREEWPGRLREGGRRRELMKGEAWAGLINCLQVSIIYQPWLLHAP